jgi:hypothetical protein
MPQLISLDGDLTGIPLFIAGKINNDKTLNIFELEANKNTPFCLLFYPDSQNPPLKNVDPEIKPIVEEYWNMIQPMLICRDMSGYYLGSVNDSNIVLFEQCNLDQAECSVYKVLSGYNESTMQTESNPVFSNSINLRKVK